MANALQRHALQRGLGAGDFTGQVHRAMRATQKMLADVGGANSDEMKAAGRALLRALRKTVGVKGAVLPGNRTWRYKRKQAREWQPEARNAPRREPSAPGEPPRVQTARLRRSFAMTPVDGTLRVGTNRFTARLLQDGVDFGGAGAVAAGTRSTDARGRHRKLKGRKARKALRIAPRPFMNRALAAARGEMTNAYVSAAQRRAR